MTGNAEFKSPYEAVGGRDVVRQIVDRFYDIIDEPAYAGLRALHEQDLMPMRNSLTGFLTAWLGGPGDWFIEHPGVCMMSAHGKIAIEPETAAQWEDAMTRAIASSPCREDIGTAMAGALSRMARSMINRAERAAEEVAAQ